MKSTVIYVSNCLKTSKHHNDFFVIPLNRGTSEAENFSLTRNVSVFPLENSSVLRSRHCCGTP